MRKLSVSFCLVGVIVLLSTTAFARTLFVSDQLAVNLRKEPSNAAAAVKLLRTDAAMELLGEQGDFFKVRLSDGSEGFFPKRYATEREPRTRVISRLEKKLAKLQAELEGAQQRLGAASGELESERQQLVDQLRSAEEKLKVVEQEQAKLLTDRDATLQKYDQLAADASNVVELAAERDRLRGEHASLLEEMEVLRQENESLLISGVIKWFLAGGGVLFFGWLIGRASRRKRGGLSGY